MVLLYCMSFQSTQRPLRTPWREVDMATSQTGASTVEQHVSPPDATKPPWAEREVATLRA